MDGFFSGSKDGYFRWGYEGVSKTARDIFCDEENKYFLQLHRLLSSFTMLDHFANVADLTQRENLLRCHILENQALQNINRKDSRTMILVWDTGASYGLSPFRIGFIYYVDCDIPVEVMTKLNRAIGIVTTLHKFIEINGQDILFPCISYHLTQTDERLF